MDLTS